MQNSFKILSILLHYPNTELQHELPKLASLLTKDKQIDKQSAIQISDWIHTLCNYDLIQWQEEYVATFDQGISLYLFEYVHGQSKDRGQAMVDLIDFYQQHGFYVDSNELPDYLPLVLEFLAHQELNLIKEFLGDMLNLIEQISIKLKQRQSKYALICDSLLIFMGQDPSIKHKTIPLTELKDIDSEWSEPPVTFTGANLEQHYSCNR